jgi:hypothetical protein
MFPNQLVLRVSIATLLLGHNDEANPPLVTNNEPAEGSIYPTKPLPAIHSQAGQW